MQIGEDRFFYHNQNVTEIDYMAAILNLDVTRNVRMSNFIE